jgi:hypothetical protein
MKLDKTAIITERFPTDLGMNGQYYYLIVPDMAAGRKFRFTVYRIPSSPSRRVKIIGRELDMITAQKVIRSWKKKDLIAQNKIQRKYFKRVINGMCEFCGKFNCRKHNVLAP